MPTFFFLLPWQVLGTDAGGTREIVEQNVTGLLHPVGHLGTQILSENIRFLLKNPSAREQMGKRARKKVERMYLIVLLRPTDSIDYRVHLFFRK